MNLPMIYNAQRGTVKLNPQNAAVKFFGSLLPRQGTQRATGGSINFPTFGWMSWLFQQDNLPAQMNAYREWVYICANYNATTLAAVPLRLYVAKDSPSQKIFCKTRPVHQKQLEWLTDNKAGGGMAAQAGDIEEVVDHRFLDLMKVVNPHSNQFALMEMTDLHQELTGDAYWFIKRDALGIPEEIWTLMPHYVRIVPDPESYVLGYLYLRNRFNPIPFNEDEIIHFKFPNPDHAYLGKSPLAAVWASYSLSASMDIYRDTMMQNMGRVEGVLSTDQSFNDIEFETYRQRWKDQYGGIGKVGQVALLEAGMQYQQIGGTPRDMDFPQADKMVMHKIAGAFGVHISMLTTEKVNLANAKTGEYQHSKKAILPRTRRLEQKLNEKLLPMYADNLFTAFDNPVPEDAVAILKERESHLKLGVTTVNEERAALGKDPVDWGDEPLPYATGGGGQPAPFGEEEEKAYVDYVASQIVQGVMK